MTWVDCLDMYGWMFLAVLVVVGDASGNVLGPGLLCVYTGQVDCPVPIACD